MLRQCIMRATDLAESCRGADSRARCCTNDSHRLSLRWQPPPTGPVAAVSDRHGGWQCLRHIFCGEKTSSLSLRGVKRRGNLGKAVAIWPIAFPRFSRVLRDCTPRALPRASRSGRHAGLRPPRNDNSVASAILTTACLLRQCSAGPGCPLPYNA